MTSERLRHHASQSAGSAVTNWFVLLLIVLFTSLSAALIVLGAQAYQVIERHTVSNTSKRTAVGYVLNRVAALDGTADLRVETYDLGGQTTQALVFTEAVEDEMYETRLYCADGMLREQFVHEQVPLAYPEDGEGICELNRFLIIIEDQMLQFTFTFEDGETETVHAALRSEGEVAQ